MNFGEYPFKTFKPEAALKLPHGPGIILIQDMHSKLFEVVGSEDMRKRASTIVGGDMTQTFKRAYKQAALDNITLYFCRLPVDGKALVHRRRVKLLVAKEGKLIPPPSKDEVEGTYSIHLFTYLKTGEVIIAIWADSSRKIPEKELYITLNRLHKVKFRGTNRAMRQFVKTNGPFDKESNPLDYLHYKKSIVDRDTAFKEAQALALDLGSENLLSDKILPREQWKHPAFN